MLAKLFKITGGAMVVSMAIFPLVNPPKERPLEQEGNKQDAGKSVLGPVEHKPILPDFAAIYDVRQIKKAFFDYLTPYIKHINANLAQERSFIESLNVAPENSTDLEHLTRLAKTYRVKNLSDFAAIKSELLNRVDELPIELVLMQAANESAWGTSRFALKANNLFGQWCFKPGCGVVPEGRPEGETYEVRKFEHPADSIKGYYYNLNTGHAYEDLRIVRRTLRDMGEELDPLILAEGLLSYSTRREAYIDEIQKMILVNTKYISK